MKTVKTPDAPTGTFEVMVAAPPDKMPDPSVCRKSDPPGARLLKAKLLAVPRPGIVTLNGFPSFLVKAKVTLAGLAEMLKIRNEVLKLPPE